MASAAPGAQKSLLERLLPDWLLGAASLLLLAVVAVAVARGHADWAKVPRAIWFHLGTAGVVLALTPVLLWRRKGDGRHRTLGWIWAATMIATALYSLAITPTGGRLVSPIALLSLFVLVQVPRAVLAARAHDVALHRRTLRGLVIGALLIAGFFTFPFHRLLGQWLLG